MTLTNAILRVCVFSALGFSAACSSSSSSVSSGLAGASGQAAPTLVEVVRLGNLAEDDFTRIAGNGVTGGIPGTSFDALNATETGTATYTGPGNVNVFTRTVNGSNTIDESVVDMLGTSSVTFDFASDEFSGRIRDLIAVDENGNTDVVSGQIRIANGSQADVESRPTLLEADATGNLEAFDTTYSIAVGLEGLLRGTNPNAPDDIPVRAISLAGEGTVENSTLLSEISLVGDKDAANQGAFVSQ